MRRALLGFGSVVVIAGLLASVLWGRQWWLRRERDQLLRLDASRAPVANPSLQLPRQVRLPSAPPSCVTGLVLLDRKPVAGALVAAASNPPGDSPGCPCAGVPECGCPQGLAWALDTLQPGMGLVEGTESTTTDPLGHFSICGDTHRRLVWAETADGALGFSMATPSAADGEAPLLIELAPRETLTGRVVDGAHEPVARARVLVLPAPGVTSTRTVSSEDGTFSLLVPPGGLRAVVDAPGFPPQVIGVDPLTAATIVLAHPSTVWVSAWHLGAPVAGATVTLDRAQQGVTGADGLVRFADVSPRASLTIEARKGRLVGRARTSAKAPELRAFVELVEGGVLRGVVLQADGVPARNAHLTFTGEQDGDADASIDGRFESRPLPPGPYTVRAAAPQCVGRVEQEVVLGPANLDLALTLPCEAGLEGNVVDAQGAPVNQAEVELQCGPHRTPASTDTAGRFRLPPPRNSCWLKVTKTGYRPFSTPVDSKARTVRVVLDAGASLAGRVVDASGQGVRGATVVILPVLLEDLLAQRGGSTETDRAGRYALGGLAPGRLVVAATHARGTAASDEVLLEPGQAREGLDIHLAGAAPVQGLVTDARRRPIAGATVRIAPTDEKSLFARALGALARGDVTPIFSAMPASSSTGVDGRFELRPAGEVAYTLSVSARGFRSLEREVKPGADVSVTLEGSRTTAIRGRAVDERGPLTAFTLNDDAVSSGDGRFAIELGELEAPTLRFSAPGHGQVVRKLGPGEIDLGDVLVPSGRRVLVAVRDEAGSPLAGVRLWATQDELRGAGGVTDARGSGSLEGLAAGGATVTATKAGLAAAKKTLTIGDGDQTVELELRAARGAITGVVRGPTGPLSGAEVELRPSWESMRTSEDGAFHFEDLEPGAYGVVVRREGSARAQRVDVREAPVELLFSSEGAILEGGARIGGAVVVGAVVVAVQGAAPVLSGEQLIDPGTEVILAGSRAAWAPVRGGRFLLDGLGPGPWALYVVNLGDVLTEQIGPAASVMLSASETRHVDLDR